LVRLRQSRAGSIACAAASRHRSRDERRSRSHRQGDGRPRAATGSPAAASPRRPPATGRAPGVGARTARGGERRRACPALPSMSPPQAQRRPTRMGPTPPPGA
jgi:hypothetical protein